MTKEELYYLPASELLKYIQAEKVIKKSKPLPPIAEDEKPYELPNEWEWVRLGEVITILSGVSYKKNQILNSEDGTRIIRGGNIQDNEVVLKGDDLYVPNQLVSKEKYIQKGDTVIVASTGSLTAIGRPGIVSQYYQNVAIGAFLRIIRPNKNINAQFISYILLSDMYRLHIRNIVKGTSINNIKNEYIEEFLIPLPPLYIQDQIVQKLDELMANCDQLEAKAEEMKNYTTKLFEASLKEAFMPE